MPDARLQKIAEALHTQMPGCTHDEHGADCEGMATEALRALGTAEDMYTLPGIIAALEAIQQQEPLDAFDKQYRLLEAKYEERVRALLSTFERTIEQEEAGHKEEIRGRQIFADAQAQVIETLTGKLREIQGRAQRHLRDNEMMEPADVFRDAKFNLTAEMDSALRKATARAERPRTVEEDHGTMAVGIGPQESAEGLRVQLQHQTERRDLAEDMIEALRQKIGGSFDVDAVLREVRTRHDAAKLATSPDDICTCGCARKDHLGPKDPGGAQCKTCPGDDKYTWQHAFELAVN